MLEKWNAERFQNGILKSLRAPRVQPLPLLLQSLFSSLFRRRDTADHASRKKQSARARP
jgi:hypothetical protein